jgi:preprotein translocase subunit SecA
MLGLLGFKEGMAIEDRSLTRGIERAQKRVEERNFGIRKNLLEYDEVMDHQRRTFYGMRQDVVAGKGLSQTIWQMIDDSVSDAVARYLDPKYAAQCVAEWAGQHLGAKIDPDKLDTREYGELCEQVRDVAGAEVRNSVQMLFGEYVDPGVPQEEWDVRGLASFASQYGVNLTQRQIKETDPDALLEQIVQAAGRKVEAENLTPLEQYVDPLFGRARLVRWANEKFGVSIPLDEVATANREEAEQLIGAKMRDAYKNREIEYPAGAVLDYAIRVGGQNVNEVYNRITSWVNRKFGLNWTYEHFVGKSPQQVFEELRDLNAKYMSNGLLDKEIESALAANPGDQILDWARKRFGTVLEGNPITPGEDVRDQLRQCGYEMLRYELTQVERMVLLQTFDAVWKDHMYSIDLLRHSIGLRGYAEKDPKIEYKREATRMFNETQANIRERVTDLIFKVNIAIPPLGGDGPGGAGAAVEAGPGGGLAYGNVQATKADATNAGLSADAAADQQAAMRNQGDGAKVEPIKRSMPRVGRNEPCPCGSGKKYKACHGKNA